MSDDFGGLFRTGGLYHRKVKTVVGKTCQGLAIFDELDQKGRRTCAATWPAIEITQQCRLVRAAKKNFWIALNKIRRDWRKAYRRVECIHRVVSLPQFSAGQVRGNTEPAL
ncbi:high-affinity branched-chain amino acid transport protein [Pseudomonas chlororaphis subsp. aurantiaca]|nr:high-affinity branched-chain amino acid transport protein [Pseudomonas chlororaphis subsp. aurantiaca]